MGALDPALGLLSALTSLPAAFCAATALVAAVTALAQAVAGPVLSAHAAFGATLVTVLWRPARELLIRAFLVFLLAGAGAARILNEGESAGSVLAGFAAGAGIACLVHATMRLHLRRRTR